MVYAALRRGEIDDGDLSDMLEMVEAASLWEVEVVPSPYVLLVATSSKSNRRFSPIFLDN